MRLLFQEIDTQFVPQKIHVPMKIKFNIRKDMKRKDNLSPVYLHITANGKRERLNMQLHVDSKLWDTKTENVKPVDKSYDQINLLIQHTKNKIADIQVNFRINNRYLSPELLIKELTEESSRTNFVAYFKSKLKEDKSLKKGTKRRYESVVAKLEKFSDFIPFSEITEQYMEKFRNHLYSIGNKSTTVNSNMMALKKYLKRAKKEGVKFPLLLEDVKIGSTTGNRTALTPIEVKAMADYYFDESNDGGARLIAGYFLFACMTGLRISDVQNLRRVDFKSDDFSFSQVKTGKDQIIVLNKAAVKIVMANPLLFEKFLVPEHINRMLKVIALKTDIRKKLTFHVARHTFATNFLRAGGNPVHLQQLMAHAKIATTMIYVHILADEANKEIYKLDDLFKDFGL
ncbi:site-specific integrase [Flavobacterium psychrotrophum]|uniref:site-specific integrase n=1 Tax=Flavobacterium psychrotrophum TaxID=2294119 RepID=UPI000E316C9F|nr:site-specific integrase [Flavobacterium psychrotrophum]